MNTQITATVSDADAQAVKDSVSAIEQKLPFLISLTAEQSKAVFKAGPNSLSFVEHALTAAQNNPTILPGSFDVNGFAANVALFAVLTDLATVVNQLASQLNDTRLVAGGEAMTSAVQVYNYVKAAVKTTPGLKPVADQLGERFQKNHTPAPAPATAT
jgi:hypothetical protein